MRDTSFEIRSSRIGDTVVIAIVGEIDMVTAPEVARAIDSSQDGAVRVVVDLSDVVFLDSSALSALVHCQQELAEKNIAFRIVSPPERPVRSVFDITHLTEPLHVVETLDEALSDTT